MEDERGLISAVATLAAQMGQVQSTLSSGFGRIEGRLDHHSQRISVLEEDRIREEEREAERSRILGEQQQRLNTLQQRRGVRYSLAQALADWGAVAVALAVLILTLVIGR